MCDVDVVTGELFHFARDFEFPGFLPLDFTRIYKSGLDHEGPLGYGWMHQYERHLILRGNQIVLRVPDGPDLPFDIEASDGSLQNKEHRLTLTRYGEAIVITTADQEKHIYRSVPRAPALFKLNEMRDLNGSAVFFYPLRTTSQNHLKGSPFA